MKKGFTLVELIVVIVLLSLIGIFTFPSINKTLSERKEKLYNIQIENIKTSTESYINKNNLFVGNDKVYVTLCQLKQEGFTDENVKDPRTGKKIPNDSKVIVSKSEEGTDYTFELGWDNETVCTQNDETLFEFIEVGGEYKENIDISKYEVTIYFEGVKVDEVDTNTLGAYYIEYKGENNIIKYVYIIDSSGPSIVYEEPHEHIDKDGNKISSTKVGEGRIEIIANQISTFEPFKVKVADNSGEEVTVKITSSVNNKVPGTYYVVYEAKDKNNNATTKIQQIDVVDNEKPVIEEILKSPNTTTSNNVVISVVAHDNESGLHPRGAYSFDGGITWQINNSITVESNRKLEIVVRDVALNETKKNIEITNILKDDKNISYTINKGTLKNNGWFIDDVEVLIKPLVSNEYFASYSYCISDDANCIPNIKVDEKKDTKVIISENTKGTYICGNVSKNDGTKTDTICSMVVKVDKDVPTCSIDVSSESTNGVTGTVNIIDNTSGPRVNQIKFDKLIKTKIYDIEDNAGNKNTCTVKIKATDYTRFSSCSGFKSCPNSTCGYEYCTASDCGYASCNACYDSCLYGSNTCRSGWVTTGEECVRWRCYTGAGGQNGHDFDHNFGGRGYCSCIKTEKTGYYDSCAYGSNTCRGGYYYCQSPSCGYNTCQSPSCGYQSCPSATCGCESWSSYGEWSTNTCSSNSMKRCEQKREYTYER